MRVLASKFIYPRDLKDLPQSLEPFAGLEIQLSFFQKKPYLGMDHRRIKSACVDLGINVSTVHAPTVDVFDKEYLKVLEHIHDIYGVRLITIHPQKGEKEEALKKLGGLSEWFEEKGLILAYENFPSDYGSRKWIYLPGQMHKEFNQPFLRLTFDTSHLDSPDKCIEEFEAVRDKIEIVHLSDVNERGSHQVLGTGSVPYQAFLEHLKATSFQGPVVIEYWPADETRLIQDVKDFDKKYG